MLPLKVAICLTITVLGCTNINSKKEYKPKSETILSEYIESNSVSRFYYNQRNNSTNKSGSYAVKKYISSTDTIVLVATDHDTKWDQVPNKNNFTTTEVRFSIQECDYIAEEDNSIAMALPHNDPAESLKLKIGILKIKSHYSNGIKYIVDSGHFEHYSNQTTIAVKSFKHAVELKKIFDGIKSQKTILQ